MSLGRSPIRHYAPVPAGMTSAQIYRWARLMTRWLGTFTESTWVYPQSAVYLSSQLYTPVVTTSTSTYLATRFVHPLASTVPGPRWFRTWLSPTKSGPPMSLTGISVSTTAGAYMQAVDSQFYMRTGSAASAKWSFKNLPTSCFAAVQMGDCLPVWSSKLRAASVGAVNWYIYYSVYAESGDWRKILIEPRQSSDASRYQRDVNIGFWTCLTPWGTLAPTITSVVFSSGVTVLATRTVNRYYILKLHSTTQNWVRIHKVGAGQAALHTWALPYGRAWATSVFTWVA